MQKISHLLHPKQHSPQALGLHRALILSNDLFTLAGLATKIIVNIEVLTHPNNGIKDHLDLQLLAVMYLPLLNGSLDLTHQTLSSRFHLSNPHGHRTTI